MIDPESLSSIEVLAHLKHLGYENISSGQLKEFMHDLKKLIRYEQKCRQGFARVLDGNGTNETSVSSSLSETNATDYISEVESSGTNSSELCANCNITKTDSVSDVMTTISSSANSHNRKNKIQFVKPNTKPQTSFIRPWRLQPSCRDANFNNLKTDPVQLYHKYKVLWAQQKVPGEKNHSQLRWTIREKMLGHDPQPRPVSGASTEYRSRTASCK